MKKLLLFGLLFILLAFPAQAQECTTVADWPFFFSEKDMDLFVQLVNDNDAVAVKSMEAQQRVGYFKDGMVVNKISGFATCDFRLPGTLTIFYTYCEALKCN